MKLTYRDYREYYGFLNFVNLLNPFMPSSHVVNFELPTVNRTNVEGSKLGG
jgi:hypothetical protein